MNKTVKLIAFIAAICVVAGLSAALCAGCDSGTEYLRIHIRANSNAECDQKVKYEVKDAIVAYMSEYLEGVESKAQAMEIVSAKTQQMSELADYVLRDNGYYYEARVSIRQEEFPARTYGELTLGSGVYDAIIVELGSGEGDNWWCVAFPPLCFVSDGGSGQIKYKSKIVELWNRWFG